jgi:hypothetical protein
MIGITNKQFWDLWKRREYKKALSVSARVVNQTREERGNSFFFGNYNDFQQTVTVSGLTASDLIYNLMLINPKAVEGMDFARTEGLSNLFNLSEFAKTIDLDTNMGNIAQLQGYVAERMVAADLLSRGHDVEFPTASNQKGFDLLVDGERFQVKNLASPQGVRNHLVANPDIPVFVNQELAPYFEGNALVYVTNISHSEVVNTTKVTLENAVNVFDFEIPVISFFAGTGLNLYRAFKNETDYKTAFQNAAIDTTARIGFGSVGKMTGAFFGMMLFGPPGVLIFSVGGTLLASSQSHRLTRPVKSFLASKEKNELIEVMHEFSAPIQRGIEIKEELKHDTIRHFNSVVPNKNEANSEIQELIKDRRLEEIKYMKYKEQSIQAILQKVRSGDEDPLYAFPHFMYHVPSTGVHPVHYQKQLNDLINCLKNYKGKLI